MQEKVSLCREGGCCPAVEIHAEEVWIGEKGNLAKLTREQWNTLVELVNKGELKEIR